MIICPYCKYYNIEGYLYCDDCGTPLLGKDIEQVPASKVTEKLRLQNSRAEAPVTEGASAGTLVLGGTTFLRSTSIIRLRVERQESLELPNQAEIVLGRTDERTQNYPDVDFLPYGAAEKGVSRSHAVLRRGDDNVTIADLGSANGTSLNGRNLPPNTPHLLRDGDEIRLGQLTLHVYFK